MPCELKPRDGERCLFLFEHVLQSQKWKRVLHCIVTGDKTWVLFDSGSANKHEDTLVLHLRQPRNRVYCIHLHRIKHCIQCGQLGVAFHELFKRSEAIKGARYRTRQI